MNIQRNEHQKCLTRLLEYYGLSRFGILMLSYLGVTICPSTNDTYAKKSLTQYDADVKEILNQGNNVLGFDNYNHAYGSTVYNKDRKTQVALANFTVFGISLCKEQVDTSFVHDDSKDPLPSVPKSKGSLLKYVNTVIDKIRTDLCDMNDESGRDY